MPSIQQLAPQVPGMQQYAQPIQSQEPPKRKGWKGFKQNIKEWALGKPESFQQIPTQTPQGMEALQQLLSQGLEGFKDQYSGFDPLAQQAQEQFSTQTIPGIAERFSALGSGGSQRSSAFNGANTSAAQGLSRQLAAMKAQYGIENKKGLLAQLQLGLSPQFDTRHEPAQPGFLRNLGSSLAGPGLSALIGSSGQETSQTLGGKSYGGSANQQQQKSPADIIKLLLPLLAL